MRKILIANPKGGSGKSTLAVHLASWFAQHDNIVYLGDLDRQQSSRGWLKLRPDTLPLIRPWPTRRRADDAVAQSCDVVILDTPAGLRGKRLKGVLGEVDRVVVPVSPSHFDMRASQDFFAELAAAKAVRKERVDIAIVGMRVDPRTLATQQLKEFLATFDLPLVTCIRSAQRYVNAVETGCTLFDTNDLSSSEQAQWQPLLEWLVSRRR